MADIEARVKELEVALTERIRKEEIAAEGAKVLAEKEAARKKAKELHEAEYKELKRQQRVQNQAQNAAYDAKLAVIRETYAKQQADFAASREQRALKRQRLLDEHKQLNLAYEEKMARVRKWDYEIDVLTAADPGSLQ